VPTLFDLESLDGDDPFEIDSQAAHLFKHPYRDIDDIREVWASDPLFYPARPPAHWLMVAEVAGTVLMVPLAPPASSDPTRCRPIGCYEASKTLADQYSERQMTDKMTPDEEYEFYARPENQQPQGPGRRRLTATVPVRFPADLLEQVRTAAAAEDRSVSSWIRRAVEHELRHPA